MQIAVDKGRAMPSPSLEVGICGEHGGDPASIVKCERDRARLRVLLAVPRAGRPARGGPGHPRQSRARQVVTPYLQRTTGVEAIPYERFELMRYGYDPHLEHLASPQRGP